MLADVGGGERRLAMVTVMGMIMMMKKFLTIMMTIEGLEIWLMVAVKMTKLWWRV